MGTHGLYGFKYKGKYYMFYNHFDSYIDGLGKNIWKQIQVMLQDIEKWIKLLEEMIASKKEISKEELIKLCEPYTDLSVSTQSTSDPYCLFRKVQGNIMATLGIGHQTSNIFEGKPEDMLDLSIEYVYVINFDEKKYESYFDENRYKANCDKKLIVISYDFEDVKIKKPYYNEYNYAECYDEKYFEAYYNEKYFEAYFDENYDEPNYDEFDYAKYYDETYYDKKYFEAYFDENYDEPNYDDEPTVI